MCFIVVLFVYLRNLLLQVSQNHNNGPSQAPSISNPTKLLLSQLGQHSGISLNLMSSFTPISSNETFSETSLDIFLSNVPLVFILFFDRV